MKKPNRKRVDLFVARIEAWFSLNKRNFPWRREKETAFRRVVAEVLLQRTQAQTVAGFYKAFFQRFPAWHSLDRASPAELEAFLKPIGLWQRRASSLKNFARHMVQTKGVFPRERKDLENIPAVGQYVASAILMFVHGERAPLLDVNMARVLERYFGPRQLADIRYDPWLQYLSHAIVAGCDPMLVNWAILDLGAMVCTARIPKCEQCPLWAGCKWRKENRPRVKV